MVKKFQKELDLYLRARFSLLIVVTKEEERVLNKIENVAKSNLRPCISWDGAEGFKTISEDKISLSETKDPISALDEVEKETDNAIFIFKDFHDFWENHIVKRKLRNVAQRLKYTRKSVIIVTPYSKVPDEIQDESVIVNFDLPDFDELNNVLDGLLKTPNLKVNLTPLGKEKIVQASIGMTTNQAQRVFAKAIVDDGMLDDQDIEKVTDEKKQIVHQSEALEFYSTTETPDNVGGLEVLKEWLNLREKAFSREARDYGLPAPKGIALIGIPGTGKSLTAKMIGGLWKLPLLRLDVGALFGSLVGESEERTRRALQLAETISPCVLWIDEIEKAFSVGGGGDSGTSQRVFANILTWMQEKTAPCFVVATANNISALPPELLRKGRFDEIFFLDLPTDEERKEILSVHLKKRNRMPQAFDIERLAQESKGYVGAEIEQAVIDAMYLAFNDNMRDITTDDVSESIKRQVPLSISQHDIVKGLRKWLQDGRAQSASFQKLESATESFVELPLLDLPE